LNKKKSFVRLGKTKKDEKVGPPRTDELPA